MKPLRYRLVKNLGILRTTKFKLGALVLNTPICFKPTDPLDNFFKRQS